MKLKIYNYWLICLCLFRVAVFMLFMLFVSMDRIKTNTEKKRIISYDNEFNSEVNQSKEIHDLKIGQSICKYLYSLDKMLLVNYTA